MKPVLIGTKNPYDGPPLAPDPAGCSGWRLWKMLESRSGARAEDYVSAFIRTNLQELDSNSDMKAMFEPGSTVVLLGDQVRKFFNLPKLLIHPQVRDGISYRQIPHPSGRCRFYNDPIAREVVAILLADLYYGSTR